ncbi:hypothetical protein Tco_0178220 [Tanacetum coccineum]
MYSSEVTKGGSSKAPTDSKTGRSRKRKESISAKDSHPSQPLVSTPANTGIHKEDQQAAGGLTSLGVISTGPNVLVDKTKTGTRNAAKPSEEIKFGEIMLEDLAKLVPNVKADFKDLDSLEDDPIIVVDDSEEDEEEDKNNEIHSTKNDKTEDISASTPPSLNSLSTELKEIPSKFNELTDEVKVFKTHVYGLKIEVPGDLKELPTKLEEFTTTFTSLISQVAQLKSLKWELPAEFLSVPNQVASAQAKLKTLDALPSLLLKVTQALNMFAKVLHSTTSKAGDQRVPSAGQDGTMLAEGEKNTNQATISQLFQRRAKKNTERKNLNKLQPKTTSPPNPPIIITTTHMQSPFLSNPPESSS